MDTTTAFDEQLERARAMLDAGEPTLAALAHALAMSASQVQRRFTARFGLSPAAYLAQRKLGRLKRGLRAGADVTTALHDAGYGSPSRVYESGAARLGMAPSRYRRGGAGEEVRWCLIDTTLGRALIAATTRGICAIELGDDDTALATRLRDEFPNAQLERVDAGSRVADCL